MMVVRFYNYKHRFVYRDVTIQEVSMEHLMQIDGIDKNLAEALLAPNAEYDDGFGTAVALLTEGECAAMDAEYDDDE